jgi:zona occludens toxin (predicted ATPase)
MVFRIKFFDYYRKKNNSKENDFDARNDFWGNLKIIFYWLASICFNCNAFFEAKAF